VGGRRCGRGGYRYGLGTHPGAGRPALFPPAEVGTLLGDPAKAQQRLGWTAESGFGVGVEMIMDDLELAKRDAMVAKEGYKVYSRHE